MAITINYTDGTKEVYKEATDIDQEDVDGNETFDNMIAINKRDDDGIIETFAFVNLNNVKSFVLD